MFSSIVNFFSAAPAEDAKAETTSKRKRKRSEDEDSGASEGSPSKKKVDTRAEEEDAVPELFLLNAQKFDGTFNGEQWDDGLLIDPADAADEGLPATFPTLAECKKAHPVCPSHCAAAAAGSS